MRLLHMILAAPLVQSALASPNEAPRTISTRFSYTASVPKVPPGTKTLDVWLPIPSDNAFQKVTNVRVDADVDYLLTRDGRYGNRMVYVRFQNPDRTPAVTVSFDVTRSEATATASPLLRPLDASEYVGPDRLVPVDGRFHDIAEDVAGSQKTAMGKAKAFFDHILSTMTYDYDKKSPEYGQGDVAFVCDYKSGNCSDLHSYLISLSRAMGIPAYIEYGFPITGIPLGNPIPKTGTIGGYHCWAWLDINGKWTPFDASDARKWLDVHDTKMKDHLLGNLVLERSAVAMSRGRDIVLDPPQKAPPLNNFIYPYAEADGSPVEAGWTLKYERLSGTAGSDVQRQIDRLRETVEQQQRQIAQLQAGDGQKTLTAATVPIAAKTSTAVPAQVSTKSKEMINVYGFLRTDAIYDTQDQSPNIQFPFFVRSPDDTGGNTDRFTLHPRLTRLGLDFNAPDGAVPGWKSTGKVEIDFQGGGSESRPNPRARHLYLRLERNGQSWLFGQTSDLISPLFPSPNDDSIMWNAGNLGDRRPQIRYTSGGDTEFAVALGLTGAIDGQDLDADGVRDGEDSGVPNVQARVAFKSGGSTFGVWGHVASEQTNTPIGGSTHFRSDSLGVDWHVPLAGGLALSGEAWTGQDLSDFRGGIGQGVNTTTGDEIRASGGWAEIGFQVAPQHHIAFGYSLDDPVNADLSAGGRSRNWTAYMANKWTVGEGLEVGLNYIYWNTDFIGKASGHDNRFNFYVKHKF